jgi:hypothetical protein
MKMKTKTSLLMLAVSVILSVLTSCTKEEETVTGKFSHGIFIINEGPFQTGTGTITFFNTDSDSVYQDIFMGVNGYPLGNIVQSLTFHNDKGYIVVNNASKVEVVEAETFKSAGTIQGLTLPRYLLPINDAKAYISDWSGHINVVDLTDYSVKDNITVGSGPELMIKSGKYVYVLNSGGYEKDSTVSVLDFSKDQLVKTIQVHHRPTGIVEDASGKIWVLCSGNGFNGWPMPGDSKGRLLRIDPTTLTIDFTYEFPDVSLHPEKLTIHDNQLYFLYNNGIFKFSTQIAGGSPVRVVEHGNLYSLAFDLVRDQLLASDPLDYASNGRMIRFDPATGNAIDSIPAGIVPGNVVFRD